MIVLQNQQREGRFRLRKKGMSNSNKANKDQKKKKKKNRGGNKKKMTHEHVMAFKVVSEWVFLDQNSSALALVPPSAASCVVDDFVVQKTVGRGGDKVVFELHSHSKCSDGFLSPSKVVERAHLNGVKVLALTDHDTMAGIPEWYLKILLEGLGSYEEALEYISSLESSQAGMTIKEYGFH